LAGGHFTRDAKFWSFIGISRSIRQKQSMTNWRPNSAQQRRYIQQSLSGAEDKTQIRHFGD
jgi:hypothetical protein